MNRSEGGHGRPASCNSDILLRDKILEAVAYGAERLLRSESREEAVDDLLARLGRAVDVCRAYLFETRAAEDGRILASQRAEWVSEGIPPQIDNPDLQDLDCIAGGYERWVRGLEAGKAISGHVRDLPEGERAIFEAYRILSYAVVPVFAGPRWWGFIGFDACRAEREWPPLVIDALRTAAGIVGAAIHAERSEADRHAQMRLMEEIFEGVQEGIGIVDAEEKVVFFNPAYARIFEEDVDSFRGRSLHDYLDEDGRATILRETEARRRGESSTYELPIVSRSGRRKILRVAASPRFDDQGVYIGAFGSVLDLTGMKAAEAALRESEAMWRSVTQDSPDTIIALDRDLVVRFANHTSHGVAPGDFIGTKLHEHLRPGERRRVREVLEGVLSTREAASYETLFDAPDGNRYQYETRVVPCVVDGEVVGLTLSARDVTERNRMETALRESERMYRGLVDNALVGIVRSRTDGTILFVNEALARAAGFDSTEAMLAAGALPRYKHPEEREEMVRLLREEGRIETFPTTMVTRDGKTRYGLVSARLDGDVLTSIVLDNTEQREAEEKLKQYSARLEEMVEERTRELRVVHEKLVRRERLATLGQLAGGVGHELRNPLGAIRNAAFFLGMALETPDPEVREAIEILNDQVTAADRIIGSLLDFARRDRPALRPVVLAKLADEVLDEAGIPGEITVERHFDPDLPAIQADPVQLRQVIGNLVLNAVQAMPDGGTLAVGVERPDPAWAVLSVSDTGFGIAEENRAWIFTPLFTTRPSGIGLGLANSKRFVELHGGTIRFRERRGPGTVFSIRLPVGGPEKPRPEGRSSAHPGGAMADGVARGSEGGGGS